MKSDRRNIALLVASHKEYDMPDDPMYMPIWVGARINPSKNYTPDNTGENISRKNKNYCELTAIYWAWKNLESDYIGLCHYRRYFKGKKRFPVNGKQIEILSKDETESLLDKYDVILPRKRNYYIETTYSQYVHAHHRIDLDTTRQIIEELYPEYVEMFDKLMNKTAGHKFNMFIMRRDIFDNYCDWLFSILFELERRLDISGYSVNDARVFGFVAERLLDVWIETNGISYGELPLVNCESQNWPKKGAAFLKRKFFTARKA